jgi:hypothetical protein
MTGRKSIPMLSLQGRRKCSPAFAPVAKTTNPLTTYTGRAAKGMENIVGQYKKSAETGVAGILTEKELSKIRQTFFVILFFFVFLHK